MWVLGSIKKANEREYNNFISLNHAECLSEILANIYVFVYLFTVQDLSLETDKIYPSAR